MDKKFRMDMNFGSAGASGGFGRFFNRKKESANTEYNPGKDLIERGDIDRVESSNLGFEFKESEYPENMRLVAKMLYKYASRPFLIDSNEELVTNDKRAGIKQRMAEDIDEAKKTNDPEAIKKAQTRFDFYGSNQLEGSNVAELLKTVDMAVQFGGLNASFSERAENLLSRFSGPKEETDKFIQEQNEKMELANKERREKGKPEISYTPSKYIPFAYKNKMNNTEKRKLVSDTVALAKDILIEMREKSV